jgi:hypothetical protein
MTDTVDLPPPHGWIYDEGEYPHRFAFRLPAGVDLTCSSAPVYTAGQLRAAILAERERCAKLCDALPDWPEYADNHDVSDGASACAAAIRKAP